MTEPQRSSLNVTVDSEGNIWQYAPNQPGGLIKLGSTGSAPATDNERNKEVEKEADKLRKDNDHLKDRIRTLQGKIKEVEEELADAKKAARRK